MVKEAYTEEAMQAARAILNDNEIPSVFESDFIVKLMALAWLDGCQTGMGRAQSIITGKT